MRWSGADLEGWQVDHINGDRLDNRRCNLRLATHQENRQNNGLSAANKTGLRGVDYRKDKRKFRASIMIEGKTKHLGYFETAQEASEMYEAYATTVFGDFNRKKEHR